MIIIVEKQLSTGLKNNNLAEIGMNNSNNEFMVQEFLHAEFGMS